MNWRRDMIKKYQERGMSNLFTDIANDLKKKDLSKCLRQLAVKEDPNEAMAQEYDSALEHDTQNIAIGEMSTNAQSVAVK